MRSPRVLVVLKTDAAWSRGILRGFVKTAHERGWTLLQAAVGSEQREE